MCRSRLRWSTSSRPSRTRWGLTYLFISHDLAMVRHIADRVTVMYLGRFMEFGDVSVVYESPLHPYTVAPHSAVPVPDPIVESGRRRNHPQRRHPEPRQSPARMPLQHPLSDRPGTLHHGGARMEGSRERPLGGVPFCQAERLDAQQRFQCGLRRFTGWAPSPYTIPGRSLLCRQPMGLGPTVLEETGKVRTLKVKPIKIVAMLAAFVVVVAACGDDDTGTTAGPVTTTSTTAATATTADPGFVARFEWRPAALAVAGCFLGQPTCCRAEPRTCLHGSLVLEPLISFRRVGMPWPRLRLRFRPSQRRDSSGSDVGHVQPLGGCPVV